MDELKAELNAPPLSVAERERERSTQQASSMARLRGLWAMPQRAV